MFQREKCRIFFVHNYNSFVFTCICWTHVGKCSAAIQLKHLYQHYNYYICNLFPSDMQADITDIYRLQLICNRHISHIYSMHISHVQNPINKNIYTKVFLFLYLLLLMDCLLLFHLVLKSFSVTFLKVFVGTSGR